MQVEREARARGVSRNYIWSYFELHARQRMNVFGFWLVLVGLLVNAMISAILRPHPPMALCLGGALMVMAFVFWQLDERTRFLIHIAEKHLKRIEGGVVGDTSTPSCPPSASLAPFCDETADTELHPSWRFWKRPLAYSSCFWVVYTLAALGGLAGIVWASTELLTAS